jgi:hypothetical protein
MEKSGSVAQPLKRRDRSFHWLRTLSLRNRGTPATRMEGIPQYPVDALDPFPRNTAAEPAIKNQQEIKYERIERFQDTCTKSECQLFFLQLSSYHHYANILSILRLSVLSVFC